MSTPEPQVLLTPPRCLTANRTQHGVLLTWLPPANHSSPVDRYIMEFRLGERWEVLDDLIPAPETELIARDLVQVQYLVRAGYGRLLPWRVGYWYCCSVMCLCVETVIDRTWSLWKINMWITKNTSIGYNSMLSATIVNNVQGNWRAYICTEITGLPYCTSLFFGAFSPLWYNSCYRDTCCCYLLCRWAVSCPKEYAKVHKNNHHKKNPHD